MQARPFDMFVLVGAERRRHGLDYSVVPDRGVAAMAEAEMGTQNYFLSDTAAKLVAQEVRSNCSDDPDDLSCFIRQHEHPLAPHYGPARLVASLEVARMKVGQEIAEAGFDTYLSVAAWLVDESAVFVAWAGSGVHVHRIRHSIIERVTAPDRFADPPWGTLHTARSLATAGDLFVLSSGWTPGLASDGDDLLPFLAVHPLEHALLAAMHEPDWQRALPCLAVRFR